MELSKLKQINQSGRAMRMTHPNTRLIRLIFAFTPLVLIAGIVFSQPSGDPDFTLIQEIGQISPRGVDYDPNFDRFVMIDVGGRLVLADAQTRDVQHILYERGPYYGYTFSNNGRWLAVAQGNTVHIWNTETGERDLELQPTVALSFSEQLQFSDDDSLLLFKAIVPAPDELRVSEDDTSLTPWLWDLEAERGNRAGILPAQRRGQPFFDLRTELLLTPNNKLIAALPRSISVTDFSQGDYEIVTNLETNRFEFDPIDIWYSLRGEHAYFRTTDQTYFQINTVTGDPHRLPIGRELGPQQINAQADFEFSQVTQYIGDGDTRTTNSLLRLLLTDRYHPNEAPLSVILLDVLDPVTVSDDQASFLLYILNEETGRGVIDLVRPPTIMDFAVNPTQTQIAVRRSGTGMAVEIYDIRTGHLISTFEPRYPDVPGNTTFAFDATGDDLLVGWGRYDVLTGEDIVEAPQFHPGFGEFTFADNDELLVTINEQDLWVWDIATGVPVRRETIRLNGELIERSLDAGRYLTRLPFPGENVPQEGPTLTPTVPAPTEAPLFDENSTDPEVLLQAAEIPAIRVQQGDGLEIYDLYTGERERLFYDLLPNRDVIDIIASPDWRHLLIVYAPNPFSPYFPGNEIAIYSVADGLLWYYAGDDLPAPGNRRYGWRDNNTAFVVSTGIRTQDQPERIYGVEYDPAAGGMPACLVEAFPELWPQWLDEWDRRNLTMSGDGLARLAQRLCSVDLSAADNVDDVFQPTRQPNRPPSRPTSSAIAGLPSCLSSFYGRRAAEFAPQWRALTEGLDDTQITEVEEILCAGLRDGVDIPVPNVAAPSSVTLQSVSIDVRTGERTLSAFSPVPIAEPRPLEPVLEAFRDQFGFLPAEARLSDNAQLLAIRTPSNHVRVYRLNRPYDTYINALQATANAALADGPVAVSLLATPTPPGVPLGGPRPTLTPTITPTAPARPQATAALDAMGEVGELCEHDGIYTLADLPADFAASGRLLTVENADFETGIITVYDPTTGHTRLGENLVDAGIGQLSPGQDWLLIRSDQIVVAEADGSNPVVLYESFEQSQLPQEIFWLDEDRLQILYEDYLPELSQRTFRLQREYDVPSGEYATPVTPTPLARINNVPSTNLVSVQPLHRQFAVLHLSFNTGVGQGFRYYIRNMATGEIDYFARVSDGITGQISWSPTGDAMYYRFADDSTWYVFDPATEQHFVIGDFPTGEWSRDGRYRWAWIVLDQREINERIENDQPVPNLQIWDSETGLTRQYCIPGGERTGFNARGFWSPDGRYLAFNVTLPTDFVDDQPRQRTLLLDTQTGSVTELARTISRLILWTE